MSRRGENIYRRKDKRWEGRYIKEKRKDGSIQYGYIYGHSYKETKEKLLVKKYEQQIVEKQESNMYYRGSVDSWSTICLEKWKDLIKITTYNTYKYKLTKYVIPYLGDYELVGVKQTHIRKLMDSWRQKGLSERTINYLFHLTQRLFTCALKESLIPENPCLNIVLPRQNNKKINPLSLSEQKRLEKIANKDKNGSPIILALHLGLRIGEVSALKWENIDFDKNVVHITETYQRVTNYSEYNSFKTTLSMGTAKTKSSERSIPLTDLMIKKLKNIKKDSQSPFVFSINGKPMEPRLITYYFHKIREKADLENVHFHQLRHTFATRLLESKVTITSISELLGHHSTKMTLDIYTGSVYDDQYQALIKMENCV